MFVKAMVMINHLQLLCRALMAMINAQNGLKKINVKSIQTICSRIADYRAIFVEVKTKEMTNKHQMVTIPVVVAMMRIPRNAKTPGKTAAKPLPKPESACKPNAPSGPRRGNANRTRALCSTSAQNPADSVSSCKQVFTSNAQNDIRIETGRWASLL